MQNDITELEKVKKYIVKLNSRVLTMFIGSMALQLLIFYFLMKLIRETVSN